MARRWQLWGLVGLGLAACRGAGDAPTAPVSAAARVEAGAIHAPQMPAIAAHLGAENTMGFMALERLDRIGAEAERILASVPEGARGRLDASLVAPGGLRARLGFDLTTAEGWASVGLDAAGGVAVVLDDRLGGRPLLALRVTDEARLRATLTRLGAPVGEPTAAGALQVIQVGDASALVAKRGPWTLVLPQADAAQDGPILAAVAAEGAPLSALPAVTAAFSEGVGALSVAGWLSAPRLVAFARARGGDPAALAVADHYAQRFSALSYGLGEQGGALRVLTAPAGQAALEKLFALETTPPDFAKHLVRPLAFRFDLRFDQLFEGLGALAPPGDAEIQQGLAMAQSLLPQVVGFTFDELGAALTGHGLVQLGVPSPGHPPQVALALGVADPARTTELVNRVAQVAANRIGTPATPAQVADRPGTVLVMGPLTVAIVLADGLLWVGDKGTVEAALLGGKPSASLAEKVNQSAAFASLFRLDALGDAMPLAERAAFGELLPAWRPYLDDGWLVTSLRLDARGLRLGEGPAGAAVPGVLAAVAIPAFVKYIRRAKSAEAAMHLSTLVKSVVAYHAEHGRLPPSAPVTPAEPACRGTEPVRAAPSLEAWSGTWLDLRFGPDDPLWFQYEYTTDGQAFTVRAYGDLDCDGVRSTYERAGAVGPDGEITYGELTTYRELE